MSGNHRPRAHTIAAALGSALTLALVSCGADDDPSTADTSSGAAADDTTTTAADSDSTTAGAGGGPCAGLDEADVAEVIGEIVDTGEPVFGRRDGTEFDYAIEGCTFDVAVDGEQDPHVYSVSTGTAPDGIDLYDEFVSTRDPADVTHVTDVGDEAFVDASFGDQRIELIVRTGDGTALFVTSDPPFGVPVADQDALIGLAGLVLP